MIGELALERGLDQPLGQRSQQPALAGQLQPTLAGAPDQAVDQLLVDRIQALPVPGRPEHRRLAAVPVEVHYRLGHHISHRCQSP